MMEGNAPDLSKIVSLIMENPQLINQIKSLTAQSDGNTPSEDTVITPTSPDEEAYEEPVLDPAPNAKANSEPSQSNINRQRLLGAFKPYLTKERSKAIDTMLSIIEVLDLMKAR